MNTRPYILSMFFLILLPSLAVAQKTKEASFNFEKNNEVLKVTVIVEEWNLVTAIKSEEGCDPSKSLGICANWYINNHLKCLVNGRVVPLSFEGSEKVEDQARVTFSVNHFVENIRSITLKNDCFLLLKPDFVNTIRFLFTDYERAYVMDGKRKEITARF